METETGAAGSGEESGQTSATLLSPADSAPQETGASPEAQSNPFHAIFSDELGGFVDGWQEKLSGDEYDDLRATAANYKSLPALLKGLKESKSAAMAKVEGMVKVPGPDATPEDRAAYAKAIGVPDSPDGYELTKPEGVAPDFEFDEEVAGNLKAAAHELGLTPAQLDGMVKFQLALEQSAAGKAEAEEAAYAKEQRAELAKLFGDKLQEKSMLATRAATTFGLDPTKDAMFARADVVAAFAAIGEAMSEDKLVSTQALDNKLSPESTARDIMTNPDNPEYAAYRSADHANHAAVVDKVNRLMAKAHPGGI